MINQNLLDSSNIEVKEKVGDIHVLQYKRDMSVEPYKSKTEFLSAKMNINRRQVLINLDGTKEYTVQAGAMQWMSGSVEMTSGIKGAGDFIGKMISASVTKESTAKPEYKGVGTLMLEPTYRHILITNVADWGGSLVIDDGLFLACDSAVQQKVVARSNISSAVLGQEGLFNLSLNGEGLAVLESLVPREEIIEFNLDNDVLKIDGNMAIAWSGSLQFTVEKSSKSLLGSAVSGEGFVNVYRGTGRVWMAPVLQTGGSAGIATVNQNGTVQNAQVGKTQAAGKLEAVGGVLDIIGNFL